MAKKCPRCGSSDTYSGHYFLQAAGNFAVGLAKSFIMGSQMSSKDMWDHYYKYHCNKCGENFD